MFVLAEIEAVKRGAFVVTTTMLRVIVADSAGTVIEPVE
jgi:hypothetical protein